MELFQVKTVLFANCIKVILISIFNFRMDKLFNARGRWNNQIHTSGYEFDNLVFNCKEGMNNSLNN